MIPLRFRRKWGGQGGVRGSNPRKGAASFAPSLKKPSKEGFLLERFEPPEGGGATLFPERAYGLRNGSTTSREGMQKPRRSTHTAAARKLNSVRAGLVTVRAV